MSKPSFFACVLCVLCGDPALASADDGAELMRALEARLLAAKKVTVEGTVQSRGAQFTALKGTAQFTERNHAELSFVGQIGAQPAVLGLKADQRSQELRSGGSSRREPVGDGNNRALMVGLLRQGLAHNLGRLARLQPPEHGDGAAVERGIALDNFRPTTYILGGALEGSLSFGFDVLLAGAPAGSARLWLDPVSGLPLKREQTQRIAGGEVTVVETYTKFVLE